MLNFNEEDLKTAIVERAASEFLDRDHDISGLVAKEIKARIDRIFAERADEQIRLAIDDAIIAGFEREYQRVTSWGEPKGEKTSIKNELEKITSGYWNVRVDKNGAPTDSTYGAMTRAEFLMTQICAKDFSEAMKQSALNVAGALKDGLRGQLAKQMDGMLDELFRVKSLQDQGKVEKPY